MKWLNNTMLQSFLHIPWTQFILSFLLLALVAWLANWVTKKIILRLVLRTVNALSWDVDKVKSITARLANIVPALVIQAGVRAIAQLPSIATTVIDGVCSAFIILTIAIAISKTLSFASDLYQEHPGAENRPIKGYVQLVKIIIYVIAAVLIIATLLNRSPVLLISGMGAMAAVLMLIFKDTILSLVASVQISSTDLVKMGDWIEMPQANADGDVVDIALHTVKVKNFDGTVTTIPSYRLVSESFRNWREVKIADSRRIKRSILLDKSSVRFLDSEEVRKLSENGLLREYLQRKQNELAKWNMDPGNEQRRLTNIGVFRAYVNAYLKQNPGLDQNKTVLAYQLAPGPNGLPLEIYVFTNTSEWAAYENIQADIFDHLLAILPDFGLRPFQNPAGFDLQQARVH